MARQNIRYGLYLDDNTSRTFAKVRKKLDQTGFSFAALARKATAAFAAIKIGQALRQATAEAAELVAVADRLNVLPESLALIEATAERANVSTNAMRITLQRMSRNAGKAADGNKEMGASFRAVGIDAQKFAQLNATDQVVVFAEALARLGDRSQQLARGAKILDSEGIAAFLQAFGNGGAEAEAALISLRDEGIIPTGEEFRKLAEIDTKFVQIGQTISATVKSITVSLVNLGKAFVDVFRVQFDAIKSFNVADFIGAKFDFIKILGAKIFGTEQDVKTAEGVLNERVNRLLGNVEKKTIAAGKTLTAKTKKVLAETLTPPVGSEGTFDPSLKSGRKLESQLKKLIDLRGKLAGVEDRGRGIEIDRSLTFVAERVQGDDGLTTALKTQFERLVRANDQREVTQLLGELVKLSRQSLETPAVY